MVAMPSVVGRSNGRERDYFVSPLNPQAKVVSTKQEKEREKENARMRNNARQPSSPRGKITPARKLPSAKANDAARVKLAMRTVRYSWG